MQLLNCESKPLVEVNCLPFGSVELDFGSIIEIFYSFKLLDTNSINLVTKRPHDPEI